MKALFEPPLKIAAYAIASAFAVASLAGCGATSNFTQGLGPDTAMAGLSGKVHGGPNPVSGATVTLYATTTQATPSSSNNYGYGVAGTVLGTATTTSTGAFSFTGDASKCPAGQQAYIVAAGGKTNGNTANSASLLMAALGPCSGISDSTQVIINEPTTIAAAYALSGFMTVDGTTVNISAPANNNGAAGACTLTGKATNTCAAAGLAHAFMNAANLVNTTTGAANSSVSSGSITATVPQVLINTLANSVEACVNSTGDTTTPTAPCAVLMTNTTPTTLLASATAPTNTLQALLNLAQYPSEAAGATTAGTGTPPVGGPSASTATANLFNVANSNAYYSPALTAAPFDFTIAINYVLKPSGSAIAPWGISTDIDDNVYVFGASTPGTIYGLTSNGTQKWATALSGTAGGGCGTFGTRCDVVPDTLGNLWVTDNAGLTQIAASSGALGTTYTTVIVPDDAAVDMGNNVWMTAYGLTGGAGTQSTPSVLEELAQGGTAIADIQVGGVTYAASTPLKDPTFDSAGNLWAASDSAGGNGNGVLLFISKNNSLTAPDFSFSDTANPAIINGGGGSHTNAPMMDITGNMWVGSEDDLNVVQCFAPCTETGGATNYATSMTDTYATTSSVWSGGVERYSFMDGDGKIVVDDASGNFGYVSVYYPNAPADALATDASAASGANIYLNPCFVASGTTTCAETSEGSSQIVNASRGSAVDASGAIWATLSSGANLIQILGPGAPSWSQASYKPKAFQTNTSGRPY